MTARKHLKQLIHDRMAKTGERYATARRQVIRAAEAEPHHSSARCHWPGNIPATTALRVLLTHAGVVAPHTGAPFSEALLFGIAGGIGLGVFSFRYEREDLSTFFITGRHQWHDDQAYLRDALAGLAIEPTTWETGGASAAARHLGEALAQGGPCIAWVDAAGLPHRALPAAWSGGGYHVITIYEVREAEGTALIGDLGDEPIAIGLADLAAARARVGKQRQRLLAIPPSASPTSLGALVRRGLERCHDMLIQPSLTQAPNNARLDALRVWADRMGAAGKDGWARAFQPGPNFWRGLCAIYDFVEHYGTGGGLCRPLFADFLGEAAIALAAPGLADLGQRYAELGRGWAELAGQALPDDIPALAEAKQLYARKAELAHAGGSIEEMRAVWRRIGELEQQAGERFPLAEADCADLRRRLQASIRALYDGEVAAHSLMSRTVAALPAA